MTKNGTTEDTKPVEERDASSTSNTTKEKTAEHHFDGRWLLLFLVIFISVWVTITLNNNSSNDGASQVAGTISTDNGDLKINWDRYPTYDIELSESLTIEQSGTYNITGTLEDGLITVNAGTDGVVRLVLEDVSITNTIGPAIACYSADDLVIELVGENTLTDGEAYATSFDEDVTGAIYSKADLTFQGDGSLKLTSNYLDAIVGKDDVKFNSGSYEIVAKDDGIRGKDSVYIVNGDFKISAGADAIKSTNETDGDKGFVMIEGGNFNLEAGAKGIKAINSVLVYGGNFVINSHDDAVHSNNYIGIINGAFNISSGDDGMHADRQVIIDDGEITIVKSYEGIEAQAIAINGGKLNVISSDDGINAGGGADASATNRQGAGVFNADENCTIVIAGGEVYINAAGDGVDSNGWVYFNGGKVTVDGPTNNGNGALDAGMGIVMNGGTVLAVGSSGMAVTLGSSSSVYNASIYLSATQSANTTIEIKDTDGNVIIEHTAKKSFSHIAVGSESFKLGETYTLYLNDEMYTSFTISGVTTTVGNTNVNQMMPGGTNGGNGSGQRR